MPIDSANNNTSSATVSANVKYSYNNRYYYNQLDGYSKAIYDAVANNMDRLKYGTYTINIDYDFSGLLSQADGNTKLKGYYNDAINALNLDVPSLFYIDFSKMSLNIEQSRSLFSTKYKLYINSGINANYLSDSFSSATQVIDAISKVENAKDNVIRYFSGDEYNKIKSAHDWIIDYLRYSSTSENKVTVYGALIERKAVCEGYARTYKYILDELGVTSILAIRNSNKFKWRNRGPYVELCKNKRGMVCSRYNMG